MLLFLQSFEGGGADDEESEPCVETKACIHDVIENTSEFSCSAPMTGVYIPLTDCLLPRDNKLSFEGGGAVDDNLGPCLETTDCIQDVIENNSQPTCSAQTTEIYIPVPDCLLPRDDKLFHIKDENEDHLSEENNSMLYTTDPAGSDASDPLANDDLSDPVRYKCSPVKEDQISDDEEGHILNDCTDGVSSKLIHQDPCDQSGIKTGSPSVKADQSSDGEEQDVHNESTDGTTSKHVPQASDQTHMQAQASTSFQWEEVDAEETGAIGIDLGSMLVLAKKESPKETDTTKLTSTENGETPSF
ncbi:uncharacterized protein LOC124170383 [Ischnura elegans]|uniref:uncharacterized protein LOC124170383 n=1 Tax=Ischnura elegans TaxID=197161 RepID=UPI001ED8924B|nr:uncharacterized protein LOC124170383 [Ischnura elegans]